MNYNYKDSNSRSSFIDTMSVTNSPKKHWLQTKTSMVKSKESTLHLMLPPLDNMENSVKILS